MIDLHGNEVVVFSHESWRGANLASLLGPVPAPRASVLVSPDLGSEPLCDILAPVVEWVRTHSSGTAIPIADSSPEDSATVNLGNQSLFYGLKGRLYFGTRSDVEETNRHHLDEIQEYKVGRYALESDILINVTALQSHGTAGISASLHSVTDLRLNSDWLPHHSIGTPKTGGDSFPDNSVRSRLHCAFLGARRPARRLLRHLGNGRDSRPGNWWGNDTLWRSVHDLNRALLYARKDGTLASNPQRQTFSVVDAVVVGHARGGDHSDPTPTQLVIAGPSFSAVDLVCAKVMGFDWKRIPHLSHVFDDHDLPLVDFRYDDILVSSEIGAFDGRLVDINTEEFIRFESPAGWAGWLEACNG